MDDDGLVDAVTLGEVLGDHLLGLGRVRARGEAGVGGERRPEQGRRWPRPRRPGSAPTRPRRARGAAPPCRASRWVIDVALGLRELVRHDPSRRVANMACSSRRGPSVVRSLTVCVGADDALTACVDGRGRREGCIAGRVGLRRRACERHAGWSASASAISSVARSCSPPSCAQPGEPVESEDGDQRGSPRPGRASGPPRGSPCRRSRRRAHSARAARRRRRPRRRTTRGSPSSSATAAAPSPVLLSSRARLSRAVAAIRPSPLAVAAARARSNEAAASTGRPARCCTRASDPRWRAACPRKPSAVGLLRGT